MPLKMYSTSSAHPLSKIKSVIAVAAGKGGVGKSTLTVNLALALKQLGYAVGIMDTDIYGPSVRKMLHEDRLPTQKGEAITPALCQGIPMISMAYFRKDNEAAAVRAPIANGLISQFITNVQWGELDYLLVDFPPGTGDVQLTLGQKANLAGALIVTTPQEVAILDVRKAMNLFQQLSIPIVGIVENMSYYQDPATDQPVYLFGQGGGERLAIETGYPFLGSVPIDPLICECGDRGLSLFNQNPLPSAATEAFLSIAKEFVRQVEGVHIDQEATLSHFELVWKEMN